MIMFAICCLANKEERFLQGNKYYQEHAFERALEAYEKIENKGSAVLFNIGNCYFKLGNECQAIAYWLRADNKGPWAIHQKVDHNCDVAYKKVGKEYSQSNLQSLYCSFVRVLNFLPLLWWQLLFLCVWIFSIIAIVHAACDRQWWRVILLLFLVWSIMICFVIRYKSAACGYALVIEKDAAVRTGPSDNYGMVATANCLDKVDIDGRHDNWLKIHNKSFAGWIDTNKVTIIDNKL